MKVSPGCAHCYAETFAERFRGVPGHPYEQGFDLCLVPEKLTEPLSWKKPRRVFVNSMSDLFQDGVPDEYIDRVFAVMALAPQHTFQVLTKRADRMLAYFDRLEFEPERIEDAGTDIAHDHIANTAYLQDLADEAAWPLSNAWLGVSVENQHFADERIPLLLQTPASVRFISAEPLLGPIDLTNVYVAHRHYRKDALRRSDLEPPQIPDAKLDWVIVGGESGPKARQFDLAWARSIVEQCRSAGVPCFVKQLGTMPFDPDRIDEKLGYVDLKSRKGGDMAEWPEDLRVREFPR